VARARLGSRSVSRANKAGIVVATLFAAAIFVMSRGGDRSDRPDVVVVGDSFAEQSADQFLALARADGYRAEVFAYGGSSICSWESQLADLVEREPRILVLSFAGNDLHPCINPDKIADRSPRQVADIYRDQLDAVVRQFHDAGSKIYVVGPPPVKNPAFEANAAAMRDMYADYVAENPDVTAVETFALLGPYGEYHKALPCREREPCRADGTVVLRQDDDTHLTPEGGKRYAEMVIEAIEASRP
jgi:hypothetical protein